ncbi:MAG TPA: DUF309 domain-containing protein [Thermomicrobiales bacterium]|nr:DUF309 domain-containing protein [Thermomicrobiales bacterium]
MTDTVNRLGISSGAFWPHAGTTAVPALVGRLGVRAVEVMLQDETEYDAAFVRSLRGGFDAVGAAVHSVHIKQKLHLVVTGSPEEVRAGWELFDRGIAATVGLGASVLVWHGPSRREPGMPAALDRFPEAALRLAERCRAAGLTLAIENVAYCALPAVREVRRFAGTTAGSGIGFTFDPFQASDAGAAPLLVLDAMGDQLANVHLSDHRPDSGQRHLAPGDGDLPWSALLRMVAARYDGPLILESPLGPEPDEPFRRVAAYLVPRIAAARVDPLVSGQPPEGVRAALDLFNAGHYYAAHEGLEHEWHAEPGPIRDLYQGILQVGVGVHHARNGNRTGADIKLAAGLGRLRSFLPVALGLDVAALVATAERYQAWVRQGEGPEPPPPVVATVNDRAAARQE